MLAQPVLRLILYVLFTTLHTAPGFSRAKTTLTSYEATKDFLFQATTRHDILYNPSFAVLVKRVSLSPLFQAIEALQQLLLRYRDACSRKHTTERIPFKKSAFVKIPGISLTVTQGIQLCKELGDDYKLIELQSKGQVANFLSEAQDTELKTPAAVYYDTRQNSLAYFSSHHPVKKNPAVSLSKDGSTMSSYDGWSSYEDYFGQYEVVPGSIYLNMVKATTTYNYVYCMREDKEEVNDSQTDTQKSGKACALTLNFLTDVANTSANYVYRLKASLAGNGKDDDHIAREKEKGKN